MLHIFTDSSVDPVVKRGIGCFIFIESPLTEKSLTEDSVSDFFVIGGLDGCDKYLNYVKFEETSSTEAELQTFKHIMSILDTNEKIKTDRPIYLYTDCQRIVNLYTEKSYPKDHTHSQLYKDVLTSIQKYNITVLKIKGHSNNKSSIADKIFSLVDKASRKTLRNHTNTTTQ